MPRRGTSKGPLHVSPTAHRTLLVNYTQSRKENSMQRSGSHQSSKPTAPQLAPFLLLPPGIQTNAIECHRAEHLLQMHSWHSATARRSASQPTHLLRNTRFDSTTLCLYFLRYRNSHSSCRTDSLSCKIPPAHLRLARSIHLSVRCFLVLFPVYHADTREDSQCIRFFY